MASFGAWQRVGSPMKVSGYCALDFRLHLFGGQGQCWLLRNFSDVLVIAIISPKAKIVQIKTSPSWISPTKFWTPLFIFFPNFSKVQNFCQQTRKIHEKISRTDISSRKNVACIARTILKVDFLSGNLILSIFWFYSYLNFRAKNWRMKHKKNWIFVPKV